ncbi:MAG: carboxypeptidase regulatory-like domain-containing protein [Candidatus Zixiibacteriota bacterium]
MERDSHLVCDETARDKPKKPPSASVPPETEERSLRSPCSGAPDQISGENEIDLSHPSASLQEPDESLLEKTGEKKDSTRDDGRISIMSPDDMVFEEETLPKKDEQERTIPGNTPDEKQPHPAEAGTERTRSTETVPRRQSKKRTVSKKSEFKPTTPTPQPVVMGKGVAYLAGNMIKFTGGVKLSPGDEIRIGDREFVLRRQRRRKSAIYAATILLFIAMLTLVSGVFKSSNSGRLIGIVMEEQTGTFVPQAKIYLKELDKTVKSNDLGFFIFESVSPGSYTLQVSSTGYKAKKENVTVSKNQSNTLSVQLSPLGSGDVYSGSLSGGEGSPRPSSPDLSASVSDLGSIRVKSNVSDPVIVIDDRPAGTGNKVYRKIEPGTHAVTASKEGYRDWSGEVEVTPGQTSNLQIQLSEDKSYHASSQNWRDFLTLGQSQLNASDFSSALTSFDQALSLSPDSPEALLGRGNVYLRTGESAKAITDLEKAGKLFAEGNDYQNAVICYTDLTALSDKEPEYYLNRAVGYTRLQQYDKSIQDLKKAIGLKPDLFPGYLNLGEAYYGAGEYKLSIEAYKHARKLDSKSAQALVGLIKAYLLKGDKSEAKKSYKRFEEISTYIDREKMKQDPDWRKILQELGVES